MEYVVEEIEYRGHIIKVIQDYVDYESPRDWDNLGTMICFHSRYDLGDKHGYNTVQDFFEDLISRYIDDEEEEGFQDDLYELSHKDIMNKYHHIIDENYIILPLYLYDHSGITMNTSGFSCPWDSGQVGYIYVSNEDAKKEYNNNFKERAELYLKGEVEVYDQFIRGDVYCYSIEPKDENKNINCCDSCCGFYGHDFENSGLLEYAKSAIDYEIKQYKKNVIQDKKRRDEMNKFIRTCWAY